MCHLRAAVNPGIFQVPFIPVHSSSLALRTRISRLRSKSKANSMNPRTMRSERIKKQKNNEKKTSVPGNSGTARRRWIVAGLDGLAHTDSRDIKHGRGL
jgi:hypothetical protein